MPELAKLPRPFITTPRRVELRRSDFYTGPVIISEPDTLVVLMEDIDVNMPAPPPGSTSPLHLGHFAALIIVADRCEVRLQGHRFAMSPNMRQRNRFMSLVDLNTSPLPPSKIGYSTPLRRSRDITIRGPGELGETAHFAIHNVGGGERFLFENITFRGFEVGCVSMSACSDVTVRNCRVGRNGIPKTSILGAMLIDLIHACDQDGFVDSSRQLALLAHDKRVAAPAHTDSLVRCFVFSNKFNVGLPPLAGNGEPRIRRITLTHVEFDDLASEPRETVGIGMLPQEDGGEAIKDRFGNLVAHNDALAGAFLSRTQASVSPGMNAIARQRLLAGPYRFHPIRGMDLRGHELRQKASLYVRIDSADFVVLHDLRGGTVRSVGPSSAAVGFMLNACRDVLISSVGMRAVAVNDPCVSSLSDARPQSGILIRQSENISMQNLDYRSEEACACTLRATSNANMKECRFNAPFTCLRATKLQFIN